MVFEDFCPSCSVNNFLETVLPDSGVCVNVLEYSRTTTDQQCYFFAGTDNGLYTYAVTDTDRARSNPRGFQLNGLDIDVLSHGQWVKIAEFSDPIIDIKTTGLSLYIVTRSVTNGTMASTLSRVDFQNTVTNVQPYLIFTLAQSGTTPFEHRSSIYRHTT